MGRRTFFRRVPAGLPLVSCLSGAPRGTGKAPTPRFHGSTAQPGPLPPELAAWQAQARVPVWDEAGGNTPLFIEAIRRGEVLYLLARDHDRKAQRSFHANRFSPCATAPWMRPHFTDASE